jgi:hypothetical protein
VGVLLNLGNGTFATAVSYAAGLDPYSIAAVDLNAEGKLDLAFAHRTNNNVGVLLNLGSGTSLREG